MSADICLSSGTQVESFNTVQWDEEMAICHPAKMWGINNIIDSSELKLVSSPTCTRFEYLMRFLNISYQGGCFHLMEPLHTTSLSAVTVVTCRLYKVGRVITCCRWELRGRDDHEASTVTERVTALHQPLFAVLGRHQEAVPVSSRGATSAQPLQFYQDYYKHTPADQHL
jgi:hypothetical protein